MLLAVANRPIDTNTTYITGGDVSRFQRRSVPARAPSLSEPSAMSSFANALRNGPASAGPERRSMPARSSASPAATHVTVVPVGAR